MPYDADGRRAEMKITLNGTEREGRLRGEYRGQVGALGSRPEDQVTFEGHFELKVSTDLKKLQGTMTVPLSEGETQALELRRD